ncbi:hypothetical protein E2C01_028787 [Portunus trituberculatus]|uniref:Uncharacterized protein n=1 Tax=Portunus trituberculatus TaxID=210409 RepID=A0A5B7EPN3_PORTR|nr:hypothetical protein [Portunus trituberculatus]
MQTKISACIYTESILAGNDNRRLQVFILCLLPHIHLQTKTARQYKRKRRRNPPSRSLHLQINGHPHPAQRTKRGNNTPSS